MSACDILIDTNHMLHFRRIDEIDWCSLAKCNECAIVITPILLRELEHNKIFNQSKALRKRASRSIEYLVSLMDQPEPNLLRPGVTLAFVERETRVDFSANGLSRDVHDDHFIACALERHQQGERRTMIASRDGGMALKLRSRPIDILRVPDDLALEAEVDPDQEELRDLRRENARLKSRQPKLRLTFADGSTKFEIRNPVELDLHPRSLSDTIAEFPSLPVPDSGPKGAVVSSHGDFAGNMRFVFSVKPEHVEKYNSQLQAYYCDYEKYLRELEEWTELARLTMPIRLRLHNDGTATATDVEVIVTVPAGALLFASGEWLSEPDEPDPPLQPGILPIIGGYAQHYQDLSIPEHLRRRVERLSEIDFREGGAHIEEDNRKVVEFAARSLKQKCDYMLGELLLTRAPTLAGKVIELDVKITLHEGEPVHQKLALTFRDDCAATD